jgi:hypothetical protein
MPSEAPDPSPKQANIGRGEMRSVMACAPETVVGSLEDIEDYKGFEAAIIADYDAETAVERELVLRSSGHRGFHQFHQRTHSLPSAANYRWLPI